MKQPFNRRQWQTLPSSLNHLHPLVARLVHSRGIDTPDALDFSLRGLIPFTTMKGIETAVALLATALAEQQRILIVGDYDADGATSTAVAIRALRLLGARQVSYLVPNRVRYGYGLSPELVALALQQQPDLLVTVDNGIASVAGVAAARQQGVRVIITDHHLPGGRLPQADAIVNPNQPGCPFPTKALAGVGVIFYLMLALRSHLREQGWFSAAAVAEPNLASLLDLVALGTIADLVPLDHNNRILVQQGLLRIRAGQCVAGITALLDVAKREAAHLVSDDLAYAIAPRLNAAGRIDEMARGIETLLCDNPLEALTLAQQLDELNRERQGIESEMRQDAEAIVAAMTFEDADALPLGLTLYNPEWHEGVIGIVASRIKEQTQRPVVVLTDATAEGEMAMVKGSARSITALHLRDTLAAIDVASPDLMTRFGGHAMAAGLTLPKANLPQFQSAFAAAVAAQLHASDLVSRRLSDGPLQDVTVTPRLVDELLKILPWGQQLEAPLFDDIFTVVEHRWLKEQHLKMALRWQNSGDQVEAIFFNAVSQGKPPPLHGALHILYRLGVNRWRGQESVQILVQAINPA
ncbi:MAG: single-stranded-DNA-specific exonuclease RecJ [Gammaproteobacteria bacterium]|nr:single-stranded-DNA-specific exonuclease RecJ [Gammaproteobacteria bacterium]